MRIIILFFVGLLSDISLASGLIRYIPSKVNHEYRDFSVTIINSKEVKISVSHDGKVYTVPKKSLEALGEHTKFRNLNVLSNRDVITIDLDFGDPFDASTKHGSVRFIFEKTKGYHSMSITYKN